MGEEAVPDLLIEYEYLVRTQERYRTVGLDLIDVDQARLAAIRTELIDIVNSDTGRRWEGVVT